MGLLLLSSGALATDALRRPASARAGPPCNARSIGSSSVRRAPSNGRTPAACLSLARTCVWITLWVILHAMFSPAPRGAPPRLRRCLRRLCRLVPLMPPLKRAEYFMQVGLRRVRAAPASSTRRFADGAT